MAADESLFVTVVFAPGPRKVLEVSLRVSLGSTVAHAIDQSGLLSQVSVAEQASMGYGVWGRKAAGQTLLRDSDRVEIYRALTVDPKRARRERFVRQGARKAAGLFAQRRTGAKAGY